MASINVTLGVTKNLGNYENIKLDASITVDVEDPYDDEEWKKAWAYVDDQIHSQLSEAGL